MAKKAIKKFTTVEGTVESAFIQRPSTTYSTDPHGEYSIKLIFTGQEEGFDEFKAWADGVNAKARAAILEDNPELKDFKDCLLLGPDEDVNGKPTGNWAFTSSQTASWPSGDLRQLDVFTEEGKPFPKDVKIGKGSKAIVSFSLGQPYSMAKPLFIIGAKPWLQGVMITDVVEYTSNTAESLGFNVKPAASGGDADESPFSSNTNATESTGGVDF